MDEPTIEIQRLRDLTQRVARLEEESRALKRRSILGLGLGGLLLVSTLGWLDWPGKTLTVDRVRADSVFADSVETPGATLHSGEVVLVNEAGTSRVRLGTSATGVAALTMQNDPNGQIVVRVGDAPFIGLYGASSGDPGRDEPQIELSLKTEGRSPRIVLRDVNGQVIWHAP